MSQRDEELWARLIDWALGSPDTTGALLDHIGGWGCGASAHLAIYWVCNRY